LVDVTNVSDIELSELAVEPQLLPGRPRSLHDHPIKSELDALEEEKRSLVAELELQAAQAYANNEKTARSLGDSILEGLTRFMMLLNPVSLALVWQEADKANTVPIWARKAVKIREWDDVARLEALLISQEPSDSFLRKAYEINREKLKRCLEQIASGPTGQAKLTDIETIQPGETISFPYRYVAPRLLRMRSYDAQFRITYRTPDTQRIGSYVSRETLSFYASPIAIPGGAAVGALCGAVIHTAFIETAKFTVGALLLALLGSVLLGLVLAFLTARSPDHQKLLTVEDVVGGFILGALAGIFSDEILQYLRDLIPSE
jgi:hypothetical protein